MIEKLLKRADTKRQCSKVRNIANPYEKPTKIGLPTNQTLMSNSDIVDIKTLTKEVGEENPKVTLRKKSIPRDTTILLGDLQILKPLTEVTKRPLRALSNTRPKLCLKTQLRYQR
jgi:hypothetical protein